MTSTRVQIGWYNGWSPEERLATLPIQYEAIRSGALARPTICSICGSLEQVWLHDEDYADPLAAFSICRCCHRTLHERFAQPAAWQALVAAHGAGGTRWFEQLTMDEAAMRQPFAVTYPRGLPA